LGPAPRTKAKESVIIIKKRKILINDVTYSNQAKTVFGRRKMTRQTNMKILTIVESALSDFQTGT
jgi:hypothetical protein